MEILLENAKILLQPALHIKEVNHNVRHFHNQGKSAREVLLVVFPLSARISQYH